MANFYSPNRLLPLLCLLFLAVALFAQPEEDTLAAIKDSKIILSGNVFDEETMNPIQGAIIEVQTVYPRKSAQSEFDGSFQIKGLPLGTHKIVIEARGYEFKEVHSITLSEENPDVSVQISIKKSTAIVKEPDNPTPTPIDKNTKRKTPVNIAVAPRDLPANEMAIVSVRSFSYDEMHRFAGSRQDPSRILSNYMGIRTQDDYSNNLLVRGNAPNSFKWTLEGVPMPNPGYLGNFNLNGGLANIFSPRILGRSDAQISAFSAEHGDAVAGVFEAQLRHSTVDKITFSGQVNSTTGIELMLEGLTQKAQNAGYFFINYRLSKSNYLTYLIANSIDSKHTAPQNLTGFQDLSFKVLLPTENSGEFTFFGLSGIAGRSIDAVRNPESAINDQFIQWNELSKNRSIIGVGGVKHRIVFNETQRSSSYVQSTIASTFLQTKQNLVLTTGRDTSFYQNLNDSKNSLVISSVYNHKFDLFLTFQGGILNQTVFFNLNGREALSKQSVAGNFSSLSKGIANLFQAHTMALWKPLTNFKINTGLHIQWLSMTNSYSVEPRLALRWEFTHQHFFSFGYGLHSQMQPLQAYFSQTTNGTEIAYTGNLNDLDFSRAHHFVLGYDYWINNNWRFHAELFHQEMFNIPVDTVNQVFSMMNYDGSSLGDISHLVNEGKGFSQGVEMSAEHYFNKGFYAIASFSIYHSAYTDYLGYVRNIGFNNNFNTKILFGKEILFGSERNNSVNIDARIVYGGPRYAKVIDPQASLETGANVYQFGGATSLPTNPYFRADLKVGVTFRNSIKNNSQTLFIEVLNFTNAKNTNGQYFDQNLKSVQYYYQMPVFFDFGYQFKF